MAASVAARTSGHLKSKEAVNCPDLYVLYSIRDGNADAIPANGAIPPRCARFPLHATNNPQLTQPTAAQEEHELEYQHPHVRPTIRSPGSGNGGRGYGLIPDTQENENFVPHPVSPLRASDEYDRHVPMPETSPSQHYRGSNDTNALVDDAQYHDSYPKPQPQPGWPEGAKEHMWTPFWLTKSVLLIFAAWFAAMMLATGLLYHFSVVHDGISAQKETNHYGWKYGPTACECCLNGELRPIVC